MGKVIFIPLALFAVIFVCSGLPTGTPTEDEAAKTEVKKPVVSSDAPKITYSKETKVHAGEPVTLDCEVKNVDLSGLKDFKILWKKKIQEEEEDVGAAEFMTISSNTKIKILSIKYEILHPEGSYRYSLYLPKTTEEDSGIYRCSVVFGAEQQVDADVPLQVLKPAYFSDNTIKTVQVAEGDAISIDCQPGGSPKPAVVWERVGQELPYYGGQYFQANRFDLPLIDRSHDGHYKCQADNGLGDPVISEVFIEVNYKPSVKMNVKGSVAASVHEEAKVICSAEGRPKPTLYWVKNEQKLQSSANVIINTKEDKKIETNTTSTLRIIKLQLEDFAEYSCVAENSVGTTKITIRIQLKTPPNIEKQTLGEKIYQVTEYGRGRSKLPMALECEGSGIPAPSYRWFKDGSILPWQADERMSMERGTGTLLIQNPKLDDNGVYVCSAYNELGTALSDQIRVTNETSIEFIRSESGDVSYRAELGRPLHFSCPEVVAYPTPELMWMKSRTTDEGIEMSEIDDERMVADSEGTLWISHVTEDDDTTKRNFKFTCLASSELHPYDISLAKTVDIEVVEPLEGPVNLEDESVNIEPFIMHSSPDEVTFKSNVANQLECIFGGEPTPGVIWEREDGREFTSDRFAHKNYGQTLIFKDTQPEDAGKYTCLGSNIVGPIKRNTISVDVVIVPKFRSDFKSQAQIVHEGATVTFACDILGGSVDTRNPPNYNWFFNGRPIEIAEGSRRELHESNLIISATNIADTGNYACKASNEQGYAYGQTTLNIIPRDTETKPTSIANNPVLQDIQQKVESLSSDVQTLKEIIETQAKENKVRESMAELLNKIAQKVLAEEEEPVPEETVTEETVTEETVPEETVPEETAPEEVAPEEVAPEEAREETAQEEMEPEETAPVETAPEESTTTNPTVGLD